MEQINTFKKITFDMITVKVHISSPDSKFEYIEDVSNEQKEYFQEISNNTGEEINLKKFGMWVRPIKCSSLEIEKYNLKMEDENSHFIYGWLESFSQGERVPNWVNNYDSVIIKVYNYIND